MSAHFRHRLPFGAEPAAEGVTRVRVWAPSCRRAEVVLEDAAHAMREEGEGWFSAEIAAPAGSSVGLQ